MSLKLVPFNPAWINHDKIDIHAIYRRPRFTQDGFGEWHRELDKVSGMPTWDLTGALPLKQHNRWIGKGFEYVTLADRTSLATAAKFGTVTDEDGNVCDGRMYDQHQTGGPWNFRKYFEGQQATTTREADELLADVNTFGSDVVEHIRRRTDRHFELPPHLKGIPAGGKKAEPAPAPAVPAPAAGKAEVVA